MRSVEDVDRMLDSEDLAVKHARLQHWRKCGICGEIVAKVVKGVCLDCRQLEGSVWTRQW